MEAIREGETIEEAKAAAAAALGLSIDGVQFEILQIPQKKILGLFGGSPARVRAYHEITPAIRAADYLKEILQKLGKDDVEIKIEEHEKGCILQLSGDDLGFIIGRRGETLDALQYLTNLVANRVNNTYYRVTLDIGNYRKKREQSLAGLARKISSQVSKSGRKSSLEPMNPYERRIIHTVVQNIKGVTSWSVGTEPNRHVVIGPDGDSLSAKRGRGGQKNNRKANLDSELNGSSRPQRSESDNDSSARPSRSNDVERPERPVREFIPRSNPLPTADGATPPTKTQSEKEEQSKLYGRIDL
ncbi:MAG: protein jag [Oscillospiraceae bacterium]|jgi:spoIIIJ-associated protein|nr:protein jag [Oscillospiraceae bacterium]